MRCGGHVLYEHPDIKYNFGGFEIPFFIESCKLVNDIAPLIPYKMLGWDVAIEKDGPIIIEANTNFSLFASDIVDNGYLKHAIIREILNETHKKLK